MATAKRWRISNPDKLYFPADGISKREVLDYYRLAAPWLLPFLRGRPCAFERWPDGIGPNAKHFWQKNTPAYYPSWVQRFEALTASGRRVRYTIIEDENTLLYLVNQGTLTFHPWLSRTATPDRPDFVAFDLDAGRAGFADLIEVARRLHAEVAAHEPVVKTSGKTGLHVLVPWRGGGFDESRQWAQDVAERVVGDLPQTATLQRLKTRRGERVYLDVQQNARGHHIVPPFVLRAVPGAPVSMPLRWSELTAKLEPNEFNIKTAPAEFARRYKLLTPLLEVLAGK